MIGNFCKRKFFRTHETYNEFYPRYMEKSDKDRCLIKAHYQFRRDTLPILTVAITVIASAGITALGIFISKIDKVGSELFNGMANLFIAGTFFGMIIIFIGYCMRMAAVHLCIMEKVERDIKHKKKMGRIESADVD